MAYPRSCPLPQVLSLPGNGSPYNLCDIVTKASVAIVVSTDPDVHFKCCISADSKVQASVKHETKGKPIQACRVHSGALDEVNAQGSTGKCSGRLFCEPASPSREPRASVCEPQKIPAKKSKNGHNALIWHLLQAGYSIYANTRGTFYETAPTKGNRTRNFNSFSEFLT